MRYTIIMAKISRSLWNDFFITESVSRKDFIRDLIHKRMEELIDALFKRNVTFYFEDADEEEMGHFEYYLTKDDTQIDYMYEQLLPKSKSFTSFFYVSDIVED